MFFFKLWPCQPSTQVMGVGTNLILSVPSGTNITSAQPSLLLSHVSSSSSSMAAEWRAGWSQGLWSVAFLTETRKIDFISKNF